MAASASNGSSNELTVTMLGCGTMGIAIVGGIMSSLADIKKAKAQGTPLPGASAEELPSQLPSKFIACVRSAQSADRIKNELKDHLDILTVQRGQNIAAVEQSKIIIIGCKPYMIKDVLSEPGMKEALKGKILVSICAGVTEDQFEEILHGEVPQTSPEEDGRCRIIRAMPSTASLIRESMTVINTPNPPLASDDATLLTWVFKQIGDVVYLPPANMDASTALCGSGPAFFLLMIEAAADGAVAMGIPRAEAIRMAAQTMKGAAGLVQNGNHPAVLRDRVCTPGGCTIGGLTVLEEGAVRGTVSRAVREATVVASQLGQGVKNVNGTRPPPQK